MVRHRCHFYKKEASVKLLRSLCGVWYGTDVEWIEISCTAERALVYYTRHVFRTRKELHEEYHRLVRELDNSKWHQMWDEFEIMLP